GAFAIARTRGGPKSMAALPKSEEPAPKPEPVPAPVTPAPPAATPDLAPKPPKKEAPPPPIVDEKAEFLARLAEKRRKALERVDEARLEVTAEKKAADEAKAALQARLSKRSFTLALKGGEKLEGAIARSFTMQEARIEAGGRARTVAW